MRATVTWSEFDGIAPRDLYAILRLRSAVFVVEQDCVFLDPDGRDLLPGAHHAWIREGDAIVACMRVYPLDGATMKISRVVTDPSARNRGHGATLLRAAIERFGDVELVLDAQTRLEAWYLGFGFVVDGERFLEDDILHTPMRLVRAAQPEESVANR